VHTFVLAVFFLSIGESAGQGRGGVATPSPSRTEWLSHALADVEKAIPKLDAAIRDLRGAIEKGTNARKAAKIIEQQADVSLSYLKYANETHMPFQPATLAGILVRQLPSETLRSAEHVSESLKYLIKTQRSSVASPGVFEFMKQLEWDVRCLKWLAGRVV